MHELFIFIPGERVETIADLERCGHGCYADPDASGADDGLKFFPDAKGPNRARATDDVEFVAGSLVVVRQPGGTPQPTPPATDLEKQYWQSTATEYDLQPSPAWLGYWTDSPPTPATLARRVQFDGPEVPLTDEAWRLPVLRLLPHLTVHGATAATTDADRLASRVVRELLEWLTSKDAPDGPNAGIDNAESATWPAARALVEYSLTKNYRGDWRLWEALGLFDAGAKHTTAAALEVLGVAEKLRRLEEEE